MLESVIKHILRVNQKIDDTNSIILKYRKRERKSTTRSYNSLRWYKGIDKRWNETYFWFRNVEIQRIGGLQKHRPENSYLFPSGDWVAITLTIPGLIDQHETQSAGLEPERCNWTRELCLLILKWLIPPIPISDPKYCNTFIAKIDHHIFTRRSVLARLRLPNREIVITEVSWRPPGKWFKYKRVMGVNDGSQVCSCYWIYVNPLILLWILFCVHPGQGCVYNMFYHCQHTSKNLQAFLCIFSVISVGKCKHSNSDLCSYVLKLYSKSSHIK